MNLAFGLVSREAGGAEFQTVLLADGLRARGHDTFLYCTHPETSDAMLSQFVALPARVPRWLPGRLRYPGFIAQIRAWFRRDRIDAAVGVLAMPHAILTAASLGTGVRVYGRRSCVWSECREYGTYNVHIPRLQRWVLRWAWRTTAMVGNTEDVLRSAHEIEGWPEDKLHLIPNGWPTYPPSSCVCATPVYVARPRDEKRVDLATQEFAKAGVPLALCFDVPKWEDVGILVHASRADAQSNAVGMAMAHGIPVVAFDLPGTRELIGRDACVRRWDYGMLAERTAALRAHQPARWIEGQRLRTLVRTRYSLKAMVDAWEEVLTR